MNRKFLWTAAAISLSAFAPSVAQAQSDGAKDEPKEIVVTARSLKETADALAACLARKCPPDEDVAASLAHAENLFVGGDYDKARATLLQSVSRNRKHGQAYPVPVSNLFRANSRVAEHMGEAKSFQSSVLDMRDTLKKGLGADDARTLVAQIEVGDSRTKLGFPLEAIRIYGDVEKRALTLNQPRVAAYARLRTAALKLSIGKEEKSAQDKREARELLEQLANNPLPGASEFSLAARILMARTDREDGNEATTSAIVRDFAQQGGADRPVLIFSEPIKMVRDNGGGPAAETIAQRLTSLDISDRWADIGFWVNADGRVSDPEVLRGNGDRSWLKPVYTHLASRVYAPLRKDGNDGTPGFYMIERYTLTARFAYDSTGTRIRRRESIPRIERIDLTPEDYTPPVESASAGR